MPSHVRTLTVTNAILTIFVGIWAGRTHWNPDLVSNFCFGGAFVSTVWGWVDIMKAMWGESV